VSSWLHSPCGLLNFLGLNNNEVGKSAKEACSQLKRGLSSK
jgi:hypothetical protein